MERPLFLRALVVVLLVAAALGHVADRRARAVATRVELAVQSR
jgi:hypothetical protein